jgi:hypothetical protein
MALYEAAPPAVGHWPRAGRKRYASTHAHLGIAGRGTTSGCEWEELRDSERTYASTYAYLGTAGRGTRRGPPAASGLLRSRLMIPNVLFKVGSARFCI